MTSPVFPTSNETADDYVGSDVYEHGGFEGVETTSGHRHFWEHVVEEVEDVLHIPHEEGDARTLPADIRKGLPRTKHIVDVSGPSTGADNCSCQTFGFDLVGQSIRIAPIRTTRVRAVVTNFGPGKLMVNVRPLNNAEIASGSGAFVTLAANTTREFRTQTTLHAMSDNAATVLDVQDEF